MPHTNSWPLKITVTVLLIFSVGWFLFFELRPSLSTPGFTSAEALATLPALFLKHNVATNGDFYLFGRHLVLCNADWKHGAIESYFMLPFILCKGTTIEAARIVAVLFGVAIIILTFFFGRQFFNVWAGIVAAILLATNTGFMQIIKLGGAFAFSIPFFSLLSLMLFKRYHEKRRAAYFYLGMLVVGLGFNTKGYFIWILCALALYAIAVYLPRYGASKKVLALGVLAFCVGAFPILYAYVKTGYVKDLITKKPFIISTGGINNLHFLHNLTVRIDSLNTFFLGYEFPNAIANLRVLPVYAFWLSFIFLVIRLFVFKKTKFSHNAIFFLLFLTCGILLNSSYTFSRFYKEHEYVLFPYFLFIPAVAIIEAWQNKRKPARLFFIVLFLALLAYSNIEKDLMYHKIIVAQAQEEKDANIETLASFLIKNDLLRVLSIDRDVQFGLQYCSDLKIESTGLRRYSSADLPAAILKKIKNSEVGTVFVANLKSGYNYKLAESAAAQLQKRIIVIKEITSQNGNQEFLVFKVG